MTVRFPRLPGILPSWGDVRFGIFFGLLLSALVMALDGATTKAGGVVLVMVLLGLADLFAYARRPRPAKDPVHYGPDEFDPFSADFLRSAFGLDAVRERPERREPGPTRLH